MTTSEIHISEWAASLTGQQPFYVAIIDEEGRLTFTNSRFYTRFRPAQHGSADSFFDLVHQEDRVRLKDTLRECSLLGNSATTEIRIKDDQYHWIKWEISCVKRGQPEKFLCLGYDIPGEGLDITEAYNARQEEKKVSERLLYISKATSEAIWDWNMETGQFYFNQALQDLVATDPGQVPDLGWCYERIHPEDRQKVEQLIRNALEKGDQSWEAEYRFHCPDGQFRMMHNRGFIIYGNKKAIRMMGSLQDVSEIRRLETQLVKQKLKQQKGVAEAIIQAQEDERMRIGHELHDNVNQIVSSAQLYLSVLENGADNFQEIKDKTVDILKLAFEEIRTLSKAMVLPDLRAGGLVASIDELVEELRFAGNFYISFTHSNISDLELMSQSKKITLYRIIQEQTKNIVRYSYARNVEICLQCSDDQVRLEVTDDGQGFDPQHTRKGLGLSNIYERTRLYNGKVILTTAPGKGCSIIVNIPFETTGLNYLNK